MAIQNCPVCHSMMSSGLQVWHWECKKCGYEKSELEPAINEAFAHEHINEQFREEGLQSVRLANFNKLLQSITGVLDSPKHNQLLDVGCAHGWFLESAQKEGFEALGIEPDLAVYKATAQRGLPIRQGFFPEALSANEQFDVIVFNDVFEHIPELIAVLNGCKSHLKPKGILALNLPSSTGLFYKMARLLAKLKMNSFFDRLWQKGFPSPHLHYFNSKNLSTLLQNNGFEIVTIGQLETIRLKGLYTRISYDKKNALVVRLLIWLSVSLILPLTKLMPSDIMYVICKKSSG